MNLKRFLSLTVAIALITTFSYAQSDETVTAFNEAIGMANENPTDAIPKLEDVLKSEDITDEIKERIETTLPTLYYKSAVEAYKAKKIDLAIERFTTAETRSRELSNETIANKCKKLLPNLYYSKGSKLNKSKDFEGAIGAFDKALEMKPTLAKAIYGKALAYKGAGDVENAIASYEKAIETNDAKIAPKAKKALASYLVKKAGNANDTKKYDTAISYLNKAGKWADAEKTMSINYQLGRAYKGKNDTAKACSYFQKVTSGPFAESAKWEVTTGLGCK